MARDYYLVLEVERSASQQLEVVRGELAHALAELAKLRADAETSRGKGRPAPPPAAVAPAPPAAAVPAPAPAAPAPALDAERGARRFRELSDVDREKMERETPPAVKGARKKRWKPARDRAIHTGRRPHCVVGGRMEKGLGIVRAGVGNPA